MKRVILLKILAFITVMLLPVSVFANKPPDDAQKAKVMHKAYRMQIPFIENKGQIGNKDVSFYAKTFGGTIFVEKDGTLTYSLPVKDKEGVVIKEIFTEKTITTKGLEPSPTKINYFKGNDKSKWKTNIPSYNSVSLGEIHKGINLTLKAYGNNVEKLFTVLPQANPEAIKVKLEGTQDLKVNEKGELEIITEHGPITFTKPLAYQEIDGKRIEVAVSYNIATLNPEPSPLLYGFIVGTYDKKRPLVIDPLLASTFIGGGDNDYGRSLTLDGSGNVYVTGGTASTDYPTTSGAYDETHNNDLSDVFVSKLDSTLSTLLASTFIGGSEIKIDEGICLAIDRIGNVYVTGGAISTDYPTTPGAYDESHNGYYDVFVSKLDSSLSSLLASTFIGGGGDDQGRSLTLDTSGNVYVAGWAENGYPTTPGAYDESHNCCTRDVFVSKLDSSLSSLLDSTFIGGSDLDYGYSLALDGSENVYVTGRTNSTNYPTTPGAYDESHIPGGTLFSDVFVSKLNSSLSSLLASTYIGGGNSEWGNSLALDGSGNVYVTGYAENGYPTTPGAYDESFNGTTDAFVSKLDSTLSFLLASTFIGGSDLDYGYSLALDGSENVYVTGVTSSSNYPTNTGAYDESFNGVSDAFVSKLDSSLNTLLASTFIGGTWYDEGSSIALDKSGNVYVTGDTTSSDYPTTPGAYDESYNGGDAYVFISKLDSCLSLYDSDSDVIGDTCDNCPDDYNPDQLNSDTHEGGDICDICPADNTDTCDPNGSGAEIIGPEGGTVSTPYNSCTITVPPGAVDTDTTFSITDNGNGYELDTDVGTTQVVLGVQLESSAANFNPPVTIHLEWLDEELPNGNGEVDGFDNPKIYESNITVVKDGTIITSQCFLDSCFCLNPPGLCVQGSCNCSLDSNYFEVDVTSFSEFALAVPLDSDGDGLPDNFDGITDNCPDTANVDQLDTYPPQGNGIGDECDCEANFNCDGNVDATDVNSFLGDFGRSTFYNPCTNVDRCSGDFDCNVNVDAADVAKFLEDFGRSQFFNPCPACEVGDWCVYP